MRTEYLDYFTKVVEIGTISAAAELLYISPQGLSQAIQQLEKELGVALFFREGSKLHLTAAGNEAYELASKILRSSDELQQRMNGYRSGSQQTGKNELFLCSAPLPTMTFLPSVVRKFHRRNPNTSIHLQELSLSGLLEHAHKNERFNEILLFNMEELEFEEAFRDHPLIFNIHPLARYEMRACLSSQSPLCRKEAIGPDDLRSHPLVLFNFSQRTLHRLVPSSEEVDILMAGNSLTMSRVLLETDPNTIGFSNYLDDLYFKNSSLVSLPLDPPVSLILGYVETAPELSSPATRSFLRLLESEVPLPEAQAKENTGCPTRKR